MITRHPFVVAHRHGVTLDLYGRYDDPGTSLSVVSTADLAALESRAAELEAALRALVEAMETCFGGYDGSLCERPATKGEDPYLYCDGHGTCPDGTAVPDTGYAAPLRAALSLLAKGGTP